MIAGRRPRGHARAHVATALAAAALLGAAPTASGQSFLGFRALGVPVGAGDGRAVALGNLGIGLAGVGVSATDPAAAARLPMPTVGFTMQPTWGEFELEGQSGTTRTTRFPLLGIGYPVLSARGAVSVSLSGHMEQRWVGRRTGTVRLDGVDVPAEDRFRTDGGTSIARLGWAQRLGGRLAVGVGVGAYLGRLEREFERALDSLVVGDDVRSYVERDAWRYSGYAFSAGFGADPHPLIHLAAAAEWSGRLEEAPLEGVQGPARRYEIPARFLIGATGRLSRRLHSNASLAYQNWSGADGFAQATTSARSISWGAGVEWQLIQRETRSFPLRLGYRNVALPFRYAGEDPVESTWTIGIGMNLVEIEGVRFGWMDLGLERGSRSSAPLAESFWRATVSLGISRS